MKKWLTKNKWLIAGGLAGAMAGFLYWYFIGCASGTCMITSKPVNSMLYGATIGALLISSFQKEQSVSSQNKNEHDI